MPSCKVGELFWFHTRVQIEFDCVLTSGWTFTSPVPKIKKKKMMNKRRLAIIAVM